VQGQWRVPTSLISADIVDKKDYTGEDVAVRGAFGPEITIPTAIIRIKSPKFPNDDFVILIVGVVDSKLPYDVDMVIGNNLFSENRHVYDIIGVDACLNADTAIKRTESNTWESASGSSRMFSHIT
jgi:hypothetical protein